MNKKAASIILVVVLITSFCACSLVEVTAEKLDEGSLDSKELSSQTVPDEMSETKIKELANNLMQQARTVFWWYHSDLSDELGIDIEKEPLEADNQRWQKVGKFKTMAQLKSATEAVFTLDFCKTNFYDKIEEHGKFKEIDGVLYHNDNVGGMGWAYKLPKEYIVQSIDKDKIVLTAICDGLDWRSDSVGEAEYEFELVLIRDVNDWKVNTYYNYTPEDWEGDLLLKDGLDLYGDEIRNITNSLFGAGMLGHTWTKPWSEESVYDLSFMTFYCMLNPNYTAEVPAAEFELFIHGFFDVDTDQIRQISEYNAEKKVYEVSSDISVPMIQSQIEDFFKVDSVTQGQGKINVSYRILWGKMATSGDGSDTAFAGMISFRRAGSFFPINSVTITEDYSDKYD